MDVKRAYTFRLLAKLDQHTVFLLHQADNPEPWIIAMDCTPTRAAVLDYGVPWVIESMFSDFKSRGFDLQDSQLDHADRLQRLMLIMALAMHWCVRIGRDDASYRARKKLTRKPILSTGAPESATAEPCYGSPAGCGI